MGAPAFTIAILLAFSAVFHSTAETEEFIVDPDGLIASEEITNNDDFVEGDMRLTEEQRKQIQSRNFITYPTYLWTEEVAAKAVFYAIESDVPNATVKAIKAGMEDWESKTCVRFVPLEKSSTGSFLRFTYQTGCWSYVGKRRIVNNTDISIGNGCTKIGIVTHEIGHALGMYHEQSRSDRDDYVEVLYENIESGRENNFNLQPTNNHDTPYDFYSMMHYSSTAFSLDGKATLRSKSALLEEGVLMGQRNLGLSYYDALLANKQYGCLDEWLISCNLIFNPCFDGFIGEDCTCICRPGTSGSMCETVEKSYEDAVVDADEYLSTREISTPQQITSFGFPSSTPYSRQNTLITAPYGHRVVLTFTDFTLYTNCKYEHLEIITNMSDLTGEIYCNQSISANDEFRSVGRHMMLYEKYVTNYRGWNATVSFEDILDCENCNETSTGATSTEVTTTEAPEPSVITSMTGSCNIAQTGENEFLFTSPNYPSRNITTLNCLLQLSSVAPVTYQVERLHYAGRRSLFFYYELNTFIGRSSLRTPVTLGLSTSNISYVSPRAEQVAFSVRITVQYDDLNRIVDLQPNQTFNINSWRLYINTFYEYWFQAPEGYQIQIDFTVFRIGFTGSTLCLLSDYVRVDLSGDPSYGNSTIGCRTNNVLTQLLSQSNALNFYFNRRRGSGILRAAVSVVPQTK